MGVGGGSGAREGDGGGERRLQRCELLKILKGGGEGEAEIVDENGVVTYTLATGGGG